MQRRVVCLSSLLCLSCSPMTSGGDDSAADLAPRFADLSSCEPAPGGLLQNPSFEGSVGSARNTGAPPSTILDWDGCCNLDGQGLTTTWQIVAPDPPDPMQTHCGARALSIASAAARGDVLNQSLTITDGAGRSFDLSAWVLLKEAAAGAHIVLDLFDLGGTRVIGASPPLDRIGGGWVPMSLSGQLPMGQGPAPRVQVRLYGKGTLAAFVDDVVLILR